MSISHNITANSPRRNAGGSSPKTRGSQFVLTSKVINAPQTSFLATKTATKQAGRVSRQAQRQDVRVTTAKNRSTPQQVALPRGSDQVTYRGNAVSFRSQNTAQLPTAQAKALPNGPYLAAHGRSKPTQAKTQAAAQKLHGLLA